MTLVVPRQRERHGISSVNKRGALRTRLSQQLQSYEQQKGQGSILVTLMIRLRSIIALHNTPVLDASSICSMTGWRKVQGTAGTL